MDNLKYDVAITFFELVVLAKKNILPKLEFTDYFSTVKNWTAEIERAVISFENDPLRRQKSPVNLRQVCCQ